MNPSPSLGIGALIRLDLLGYLIAVLIPGEWIRLLGLSPIHIAFKQPLRPGTRATG